MSVLVRVCFFAVVLLGGLLAAAPFESEEHSKTVDAGPAKYDLVLQEEQKDGSILTKHRKVTVWAVEDFWNEYKDWKLIDQNQEQIVLRKSYDQP